ncbi:hypothetical protein NG798_25800 [Ancylothrix sp. C2]|uniref:hypothetical protein n=1 Tax=Ancylothrix sp. D3o TaxID=2953691 RepID=UPI0021BABF5F|nr:hypothetical protein [Ancylothrix sp. D3o]MCT7953216.1 hypothetical protein [Ancylothrix sp. D3o]
MSNQRKIRLTTLFLRLYELLGEGSDIGFAKKIGISTPAWRRIKQGSSSYLSKANTEGICNFLGIAVADFENYLDGLAGLDEILKNAKEAKTLNEPSSPSRSLLVYQEIVSKLDLLNFSEFYKLWLRVQDEFSIRLTPHLAPDLLGKHLSKKGEYEQEDNELVVVLGEWCSTVNSQGKNPVALLELEGISASDFNEIMEGKRLATDQECEIFAIVVSDENTPISAAEFRALRDNSMVNVEPKKAVQY